MTADPLEIVAPDLVRIPLGPRDCLNAYLLGDLLVDSGARFNARKLLATLAERPVAAHALTHAHMDHQGSSAAICERLEIPLWCGAGDREAAESGDLSGIVPDPHSPMARLGQRLAGPGHPVARVLREGDVVGGFAVLAAPGHTPGHLAFWRESDRTLVLGDVLFNMNLMTLRAGLREPFRAATFDVPANRDSARRLAALAPELICFGHGPPLRDGARFRRFVRALGLRPRVASAGQ